MLSFANMLFVPGYSDHLRTIESSGHVEMRQYSDAFLQKNMELYARYSLWWVKDPLRAWSRGWEYEFVFQSVDSLAKSGRQSMKILDAGSGFTFFPFYVANKIRGANVTCCDSDTRLSSLFARVDDGESSRLEFRLEDIGSLSFPDESFDCVVCVSVLEHLNQRVAAFKEMMRVLRPGGRAVLTMDYSRDDRADITRSDLYDFLSAIIPDAAGRELRTFIQMICEDEALLTPHHFLNSPDQLPWKYPIVSSVIASLKKGRLPRLSVKDIGVVGLICQKAG